MEDADEGDITVNVSAAATELIGDTVYDYDVQQLDAAGDVHTLTKGKISVVADVTRSID